MPLRCGDDADEPRTGKREGMLGMGNRKRKCVVCGDKTTNDDSLGTIIINDNIHITTKGAICDTCIVYLLNSNVSAAKYLRSMYISKKG